MKLQKEAITKELYDQSYQRIIAYESEKGDFFVKFYRYFIMSSPIISEKFGGIDIQKQTTLVKNFLVHMQNFYNCGEANNYLAKTAKAHGALGYQIGEDLYGLWLEAFLKTLEECDPKYSKKVREAWIEVLSPGIAFMKSQY